jgi:hypothetical protein
MNEMSHRQDHVYFSLVSYAFVVHVYLLFSHVDRLSCIFEWLSTTFFKHLELFNERKTQVFTTWIRYNSTSNSCRAYPFVCLFVFCFEKKLTLRIDFHSSVYICWGKREKDTEMKIERSKRSSKTKRKSNEQRQIRCLKKISIDTHYFRDICSRKKTVEGLREHRLINKSHPM